MSTATTSNVGGNGRNNRLSPNFFVWQLSDLQITAMHNALRRIAPQMVFNFRTNPMTVTLAVRGDECRGQMPGPANPTRGWSLDDCILMVNQLEDDVHRVTQSNHCPAQLRKGRDAMSQLLMRRTLVIGGTTGFPSN